MTRISAFLLALLFTLGLGRLAFSNNSYRPSDRVRPVPALDLREVQGLQTATFALG